MMDNILGHLPFVVVYINDILVFSDNEQDHHGHLQTVLSVLQENKLVARQDKCVFGASSVEFLGHVISVDGTNPEQGQCHHRLPHSYNHHGPEGVLDSTTSIFFGTSFYLKAHHAFFCLNVWMKTIHYSNKI